MEKCVTDSIIKRLRIYDIGSINIYNIYKYIYIYYKYISMYNKVCIFVVVTLGQERPGHVYFEKKKKLDESNTWQ